MPSSTSTMYNSNIVKRTLLLAHCPKTLVVAKDDMCKKSLPLG